MTTTTTSESRLGYGFGQKLANNDQKIREEAIESLYNFIKNKKQWKKTEMDKIWKALFYCMWMSDKPIIQNELAENLSLFIHAFPTDHGCLLYISSFFRTMLREWHGIDIHRLDKYYLLTRKVIHQTFLYLMDSDWNIDLINQFNTILYDQILNKIPNGLRFHIMDIYLCEMYQAVLNSISTENFIHLLFPFKKLTESTTDKDVLRRINLSLIEPLNNVYKYGPKNEQVEDKDILNESRFTKVDSSILINELGLFFI